MAPGGDVADELPPIRFQDQVWLWLEVWTADKPDLRERERARRLADPKVDQWGYLAELGALLAAEE